MSPIKKHLLRPERVREVPRSFSWIDHRLIRDGHLLRLQPPEILLYFFLVLVGDQHGLSYYSLRSIARYLKLPPEQIDSARTRLCHRSLIAYEAPLYQVLSIPARPEPMPDTASGRRGGDADSVGEILQRVMRRPDERL